MTPRSLGLFVKKLQPKVDLGGYGILFAHFVVELKSKIRVLGEYPTLETTNSPSTCEYSIIHHYLGVTPVWLSLRQIIGLGKP